jgi:hypothetical protein
VVVVALALLLGACGGSVEPLATADTGSDLAALASRATRQDAAADDTRRGALRSGAKLGTVEPAAIAQAMVGRRVPAIVPVMRSTHTDSPLTVDGAGQPIWLWACWPPKKQAGGMSGHLYQHATTFRDAEAPSNNPTGLNPRWCWPRKAISWWHDYVGQRSVAGRHILMMAPTAAAVIDLCTLRATCWDNGPTGSFFDRLPEGGYATAAAHRAAPSGAPLRRRGNRQWPRRWPLDMGAALDELLRRLRHENSNLALLVDPDLLQNLGSALRRRVRQEC